MPVFPRKRDYHFDLQSVALTPAAIASYDCLVLATDHDGFDYPQLLLHAPLMVDTRGRLGVGLANVVAA